MKTSIKLIALMLALVLLVAALAACDKDPDDQPHVDYVGDTKLDMSSDTKKIEATVKTYIDGDTTHFIVSDTVTFPDGLVKARYLAIDTPESTGKLEEWGKAASKFTKNTLKNATKILLESDTNEWNTDNNGRHLLWIWYQTAESTEWRNLNIEILQNGYAVGSNAGGNRYGKTCLAALMQADDENLYVHSDEKDPEFPYGAATSVTIKELQTNHATYDGLKVSFEGVVTLAGDGTLYLEEFDEETGTSWGMQVFYGYSPVAALARILRVGNRLRIVGSFQYSEVVNAWQVGGLEFDIRKQTDPAYTGLVEAEVGAPRTEITDAKAWVENTHDFVINTAEGEKTVTLKESEMSVYTAVSMKDLVVKSVYTTTAESSSSKGAMTLTCEKDGVTVTIRTDVLRENGELVTAERFEGKTIDVRGIVESYTREGSTVSTQQIHVYSLSAITIH